MKTIFDPHHRQALIDRIQQVSAQDKALWGKMDAYQMLKHCTLSEELFLGKKNYSRLFIGRLFGKMALSGILKNADPMKKNQPTHPEFKIKGSGNAAMEKEKWMTLLQEYQHYPDKKLIHPFFGEMTKEQIGQYVAKHTDHHLRQFGC